MCLQAILPGSHHSTFYYPNSGGEGSGEGFLLSDKEALTVDCKAGDLIIMPLRTVHAAHVWKVQLLSDDVLRENGGFCIQNDEILIEH